MKIFNIKNNISSGTEHVNAFYRICSGSIYGGCFLYLIVLNDIIPFYLFLSILMIGSIYETIKINNDSTDLIIRTAVIIYILIAFSLLITIRNETNGSVLIIILISQIWATDIGGYIIGYFFGKNKVLTISPNKTWEGIFGSIVFCLIAGLFVRNMTESTIELHWIIISILIAMTSIFGDLIISKMKRRKNKKESGVFLPGHGGFLDRLDSLFLATPIYYFVICI